MVQLFKSSIAVNSGTSSGLGRVNDNWGLSLYERYEVEDGTLETQQYSIHRDLNSWTATAGAVIRDNRRGESDYGLVFMLTLKDFPQLSIPLDVDPNPGGR